MAAALVSIGALFASAFSFAKKPKPPMLSATKFFGSQVGGISVVNYSYTDLPWKLVAYDLYYFFHFIWALPYVLFPLTPTNSGRLDELSINPANLFCIAIHGVLVVAQLLFILSLPFLFLLPIWTSIAIVGGFLSVNWLLCLLLNGDPRKVEYTSSEKYAQKTEENAHEQWVFINGVAVGKHWMQNNLDRLAITFKRPILGVHNKTSGIVFDVLECLIQRNFGYATTDVRVGYAVIKKLLYSPQYSKVVFILHSQGAIEGSMILDWLLQELPQDLLAKLEVYTFGNAANHFNNPHRHIQSQSSALSPPFSSDPSAAGAPVPESLAGDRRPPTPESPPRTAARRDARNGANGGARQQSVPALVTEASSASPSMISDRAIGHIEHYAHTTDFVALWGVLHFATSARNSASMPRFIGRVFSRTCVTGGHQLNQHYLDGMFPLARDPKTGEFIGAAEEDGANEFMESEVVVGEAGDEMANAREAMQVSWLYTGFDTIRSIKDKLAEVELHGSPVAGEDRGRWRDRAGGAAAAQVGNKQATVKVKELSRLWKYRNGKSPSDVPPLLPRDADGVVRNATM